MQILRTTTRWMLVLAALALLLGSRCQDGEELCCTQYSHESQEATYCNNHRDAVLTYVREAPDGPAMKERLRRFEEFCQTIQSCATVECIDNGISADTTNTGFKDRYQTEHGFAERDTSLPAASKAGLILCGFKTAIEGLKQTL